MVVVEESPAPAPTPSAWSGPSLVSISGAGSIGEKQKHSNLPEENETIIKDNPRPENFITDEHEIEWKPSDHRIGLIIKAEPKDFTDNIENFCPKMSNNYLFKND